MAEMYRIDKLLAEMGLGSRSQIKEAAKKGRIQVDGAVETKTDRKIDPAVQTVTFDGKPVEFVKMEYYMLNKPAGVVSATEDARHRTVVELIAGRKRKDLFPAGRLDIDTEGLMIITNDGELAHRLLSPKNHVDKRYYAVVQGEIPGDAEERFESGILLSDGTQTMPAKLERLEVLGGNRPKADVIAAGNSPEQDMIPGGSCPIPAPVSTESGPNGDAAPAGRSPVSHVILTIREGKFHQVKRMFEALGCQVAYLKRLSMGSLDLDPALAPGEYRPLTEDELKNLRENGKQA